MPLDEWAGPDGDLGRYISEESSKTLASYREQPNLIVEHDNVEQDTAHGGYQHRQLFELVQNSADALWVDSGAEETGVSGLGRRRGRVEIRLTENRLYCADDGTPVHSDGVTALMFSHMSPKRETSQIGTFGLGFKAVLGVSDSPEFFSRSGSFRFDRARSQERLRAIEPRAESCPVLRLPEPIDPAECWEQDVMLRELMKWAVNIVRLPLMRGAHDDIRGQMSAFPAEFLLFVAHVRKLALTDDAGAVNRVLELERVDDNYLLADGNATSQWRLFERTCLLSSDALADRRPGDDRDEVPISWAAPLDRLDRPGKFWAFFPTNTTSLVPGILNAPWKTNEDRQNLLTGRYNDELIEATSDLIAEALPSLSTADDPARHLDALPRRHEAGDPEQADLLRERLFAALDGHAIVPDQDGRLRGVREISYPPQPLTLDRDFEMAPLDRWAAHPGRPPDWLHHKALTRTRLATIDRMFHSPGQPGVRVSRALRGSIAGWLEALVLHAETSGEIAASTAAIQTAALIPANKRRSVDLGKIVLTASGDWHSPDPDLLFLPDPSPAVGSTMDLESCVHPALVSDNRTLAALRELGLRPPSPDSRFRRVAEQVFAHRSTTTPDEGLYESFWVLARRVGTDDAIAIIHEHEGWPGQLRIKTRSGDWQPPHSVLMPGDILPGDGSRDDDATVDMAFHHRDVALLSELGVRDAPLPSRDMRWEPLLDQYQHRCEEQYRRRGDLPFWPRTGYLALTWKGVGPLTVLRALSDEGRALLTGALLELDATYEPFRMWHTGTNGHLYPEVPFDSLTVDALRTHGRISIAGGVVPFADALGPLPKSPAALHVLLQHPKADKIKQVFKLSEPVPEFFGEGEPIPLTDVWPGLAGHLPAHRRTSNLILCERIRIGEVDRDCVFGTPRRLSRRQRRGR